MIADFLVTPKGRGVFDVRTGHDSHTVSFDGNGTLKCQCSEFVRNGACVHQHQVMRFIAEIPVAPDDLIETPEPIDVSQLNQEELSKQLVVLQQAYAKVNDQLMFDTRLMNEAKSRVEAGKMKVTYLKSNIMSTMSLMKSLRP